MFNVFFRLSEFIRFFTKFFSFGAKTKLFAFLLNFLVALVFALAVASSRVLRGLTVNILAAVTFIK